MCMFLGNNAVVVETFYDNDSQTVYYAVYLKPSGYYLTDEKCTHTGAILADGLVTAEIIEHLAHQGKFHITTGETKSTPASMNLKTYPAKAERYT